MFAKTASFKQFSPIKGSERKGLVNKIEKQFKLDDIAETKNVLVPKTIQTAKAVLHSGGKTQVYTNDSKALWVIVEDTLIPTVLTVSEVPSIVPVVYTVPNTLKFLQNGADFMIPGIFGDLPKGVDKGDVVQIKSLDGAVLAVGLSLINFDDIKQDSGKAVRVVNVVGDTLVKETDMPKVKTAKTEESNAPAESNNATSTAPVASEAEEATEKQESDESNENHLTTEEVDDAFIYALNKALTLSYPLPLPLATFAPHIQENLPYQHDDLVIKNSHWKKLAAFMKSAEKDGKLKLKDRQGDLVIQEISAEAASAPPPPEKPTIKQNAPKAERMEAHQYYRPKSGTKVVLGDHETGNYYTAKELTGFVTTYIENNKLGNGPLVKIDDSLRQALGLKQDVHDMKRADVMPAFLKNTNLFHTIIHPGQTTEPKMTKGAIPQISVTTERRGGNKVVTKVTGVENFGLDPKATAELLRHKCAGSATVSESRTGLVVLVQGSHVPKVTAALESKGIRPGWIKA